MAYVYTKNGIGVYKPVFNSAIAAEQEANNEEFDLEKIKDDLLGDANELDEYMSISRLSAIGLWISFLLAVADFAS